MSAKTCDYCQAKNAPNACGACLNVFYCGEVCSEKGWDQSHKYACDTPQPISGFFDYYFKNKDPEFEINRDIFIKIISELNDADLAAVYEEILTPGGSLSREQTITIGKWFASYIQENDRRIIRVFNHSITKKYQRLFYQFRFLRFSDRVLSESMAYAVVVDNSIALNFLLSKAKDITSNPIPNRMSTLSVAANSGHADIVKLLLDDLRFDPTLKNSEALLIAIRRNHIETAALFLRDRRSNPNQQNIIAAAVGTKNIDMLKLIMTDPRIKTELFGVALREASGISFIKGVDYILSAPKLAADQPFEALEISTRNGNDDVTLLLLDDKHIDWKVENKYLSNIIKNVLKNDNNPRILSKIIAANQNIFKNMELILKNAARYDRLKTIQFIVKTYAPDASAALNSAILYGRFEVFKYLNYNAIVDISGTLDVLASNQFLITKNDSNEALILKLLLSDYRFEPNRSENMLIMSFIKNKNTRAVKIFLENERAAAGVDLNVLLDYAITFKKNTALINVIQKAIKKYTLPEKRFKFGEKQLIKNY